MLSFLITFSITLNYFENCSSKSKPTTMCLFTHINAFCALKHNVIASDPISVVLLILFYIPCF